MSSDDVSSATDNGITQAQVYDNLKRIGELEDEKKRIQEEIQNRTEQLRDGDRAYRPWQHPVQDARIGSDGLSSKGWSCRRWKKGGQRCSQSVSKGIEKEVSPEIVHITRRSSSMLQTRRIALGAIAIQHRCNGTRS